MNEQTKTITESPREISVIEDVDVAVIGGGPAGLAGAVAAARHGARTAIVERYGYVGGMATGGLVILLDTMGSDRGDHVIRGIGQEVIERLEEMDGVIYPPREVWGSDDPELVSHWKQWGAVTGKRVRYTATVHPEYLKVLGNRLLDEARVITLYHAWATSAIVEDNSVRGVILESKQGRLALLAKVTVDCTGDGDIFAFAGAGFEKGIFPMGVVFQVGGVDTEKARQYAGENPEELKHLLKQLRDMGGIAGGIIEQSVVAVASYMKTTVDSMVWFNNSVPKVDALNIGDLTRVEKGVREQMMVTIKFFKENIPGFEKSFLVDTAPQTGVRASRRLKGEYTLTKEDMMNGSEFDDTVTTCASGVDGRPLINIPYGCFLPEKTENLLVAGRCISTDFATQTIIRIIPSCMAMGQAVGTAAAMAVHAGISPRNLNRADLQAALIEDGLFLTVPKQKMARAK